MRVMHGREGERHDEYDEDEDEDEDEDDNFSFFFVFFDSNF